MSELLSLSRMSLRAGVTQQWLREQADTGNIPCLKAGRRYLFAPLPSWKHWRQWRLRRRTRKGVPLENNL